MDVSISSRPARWTKPTCNQALRLHFISSESGEGCSLWMLNPTDGEIALSASEKFGFNTGMSVLQSR